MVRAGLGLWEVREAEWNGREASGSEAEKAGIDDMIRFRHGGRVDQNIGVSIRSVGGTGDGMCREWMRSRRVIAEVSQGMLTGHRAAISRSRALLSRFAF